MAEVRYKAQGATLEAYGNSTAFVQVIMGPLGAGKTIASSFKLLKLICSQRANKNGVRKSRWLVTRNTYPDLVGTTIRDWRAVVPQGTGTFTFGHPPEHKLDFDLPDGTRVQAEVLFVALDRPDDVRKLRGFQLTGAWMNEMKEQPKAIFDMLTTRVDRYPAPGSSSWVGVFGDTNAWDNDHWLENLRELQRMGALEGYEFFIQPGGVIKRGDKWVVNPEAENLAVLKPDYYERIIPGKKEDWIRVNLANQIGLSFDGKPVHPDYSDSTHTATEILQPVPGLINVGIDFGLTPAAVFWQRQSTGVWFGLEEIVVNDGDAKVLADEIKVKCAELINRCPGGLTFVYRGDPSGDSRVQTDSNTPFQILRANGISAIPCSTNDAELRRGALDRPLTRLINGKPGLQLSPSMKNLRKALAGGYHYARVQIAGDERYRDVPVKDMHSHIAEAAEYGLLDAGEHGVVNTGMPARPAPQGVIRPKATWSPFDV